MSTEAKIELNVLNAHSMRDLVNQVNSLNSNGHCITKNDIVDIKYIDGEFFLLYFE